MNVVKYIFYSELYGSLMKFQGFPEGYFNRHFSLKYLNMSYLENKG